MQTLSITAPRPQGRARLAGIMAGPVVPARAIHQGAPRARLARQAQAAATPS